MSLHTQAAEDIAWQLSASELITEISEVFAGVNKSVFTANTSQGKIKITVEEVSE